MDQLLWMFSFLPAWIYHLLLICAIIGLAGASFLGKLPFFSQYKLPFQVIMCMLFVFSIWMQGVMANEEKWQAKIKEMEEKVAAAEELAKKENVRVEQKVIETVKQVKVKGDTIIKEIPVPGKTIEIVKDMSPEERSKYDIKLKEYEDALKNCPIPQIAIEIHNKAANMESKGEKK